MRSGARLLIIGLAAAGAAHAAEPRPLALVEAVENAPAAKVQPFDYLYPGAEVDLRPQGVATIAYFDSCVVETFRGGRVRVSRTEAKVNGGQASRSLRPCQTSALKLAPSRTEAGVAVKRVSPFDEARWREIAVAGTRPLFVWPRDGQTATLSVYLLEAEPRQLVWSGTSEENRLEYPLDAPELAPGLPYEVVVERGGARFSAVFSLDPGLEAPPGPLSSAVPLGL